MTGKKLIGVVFGSPSDLDYVKKVTSQLNARGWAYKHVSSRGVYIPVEDKTYTVGAGSVHRDSNGTLGYACELSYSAHRCDCRLIFATIVGLHDDASGMIASHAGNRVVALPPDQKPYPKYPSGVRVSPFSMEPNREVDIAAALDWIEREFENPNWVVDDEAADAARQKARGKLFELRDKLYSGEIRF